jgi:hypothetical protein
MKQTDNFKIRCSGCGSLPDEPTITGFKWYDANTNGTFDNGEVKIPGWRINTTDLSTTLTFHTYTDANGNYAMPADWDNAYTIAEALPPNSTWMSIACVPESGSMVCNSSTSATVTIGDPSGNTTIGGPDFGNVCLGAGGGLTLGFWSNKNGAKQISSGDLALLVALNLVSANGSAFNPATVSAFQSWLLSANATNMANMLSAQLAAMELNVSHGFVNGSALIYAPGTNSANAAGYATVSDIMSAANTSLGANPLTQSGAVRIYQQFLKNALDAANNNSNFVQPGPGSCPFTTPY